ncbi:MAG: hypothetical protein ACRDCH_00040 [Metamycoplasmataceae bacterium]
MDRNKSMDISVKTKEYMKRHLEVMDKIYLLSFYDAISLVIIRWYEEYIF